jgi:hypothetical protein
VYLNILTEVEDASYYTALIFLLWYIRRYIVAAATTARRAIGVVRRVSATLKRPSKEAKGVKVQRTMAVF